MAPQTAQEVIDSGLYLEPTFNPSTLTVEHLRTILLIHQIAYPSKHKKSDLVDAFNQDLKPRSAELKRARQKALRKQASSEGILDGVTGKKLPSVEPPAKRMTRRPSKTPVEVAISRSHRKSATPTLIEPKVEELSGTEDGEPKPRRSASKRSTPVATTKSRRPIKPASPIAEAEDEDEDEGEGEDADGADSAWERNNPFQSGPSDRESSSPNRAPHATTSTKHKTKTRAVTSTKRLSKSSSPEPPAAPSRFRPRPNNSRLEALDPPPSKIKSVRDWRLQGEQAHALEEPIQDDEDAPREATLELQDGDELVPLNDTPHYKRQQSPGAYPLDEDDEEEGASSEEEATEAEAHGAIISKKLAASLQKGRGSPSAMRRRSAYLAKPARSRWFPSWTKLIGTLALLSSGTVLLAYKQDSAYIGYCDAGSNTNLRIRELQYERQLRRDAASACVAGFNITEGMNNYLCSPLPIHSPFEANTCTPCPKRAVCTPDSVTCQHSFILKPHPITSVRFVSSVLDGMPGFGSVAFPPACVEDREKLRQIGGLVNGLEVWLARRRGERVCLDVEIPPEADGGEPKALGFELEALREAALKRQRGGNGDEIFEKALAELEKYGLIIKSVDNEGSTYVAAIRADFNLSCRIRVSLRETWAAYQRYFYSFIVVLCGLLYGRNKILTNAIESKRVAELVQEALNDLQDQEFAYHTDPVTTTEPFVVPAHLRDEILKQEHSPKVRQRVWEKVQTVVEGNANVRTNLEEVRGEETRVWRWVGSSTPSRSRRVSFADRTQSGTLLRED